MLKPARECTVAKALLTELNINYYYTDTRNVCAIKGLFI